MDVVMAGGPGAVAGAPDLVGALPPLRDDLRLLPGPADRFGAPTWTIQDPVRNLYFRIGETAFEMLCRWRVGRADALLRQVVAETALPVTGGDLRRLIAFLAANGLLQRVDAEATDSFLRILEAGRAPWWKRLLHGYLFVRVPLVRPDRALRAMQPLADLLATRAVERTVIALGVLGLFLAARQWDSFVATFVSFANLEGVVLMALALVATKLLHELGHAFTARRFGCRVPSMGVAFLVMYPVLYTDTTDAWRLPSRAQRLRIGLAGIRVELAIASLALFGWSLVPDGPWRGTLFLLATAIPFSTLLINLNPFLRFDGYYLLSDWLDVPNLQARSFALTRWWLRETLFGLRQEPPEPLPARLRRTLIAYGLVTWIYRFFLFLSIALLVYHLFFKLAGVLLFVVEILWFIAFPMWSEVRAWWALRRRMKPNANLAATLAGLAALIWLAVHPWNSAVRAPGLFTAERVVPLFTAAPGALTEIAVREGEAVAAGDLLYRFESPASEAGRVVNTRQLQAIEIRITQSQIAPDRRGDLAALEEERQRLWAAAAELQARAARLEVRAPVAGVLRDAPPDLRPGRWMPASAPLGRVVSPTGIVRAYVEQDALARLEVGAAARFHPQDWLESPIAGTVTAIERVGVARLDARYLATPYGGSIPARIGPDGALVPLTAVYRVTIVPESVREAPLQVRRGTVHIEGPAVSYLARIWRAFAAVVIRESGF